MKKLLLVLAIVLCANPVFSQMTGEFLITIDNNGIESNVYVYVPVNYNAQKAYPMFWAWHGTGMAGSVMRNLFAPFRNLFDAIVVCPDINNVMNSQQFSFILNNSYSLIRDNYNIDTSRIIITGYSSGGKFSYQIGLTNPQLVKGIIGMAPAINNSHVNQKMWSNIGNVRMATILGKLDGNYSIVNSLMTEIENKGGSMLLVEKQGLDHEGSNGYYQSQEFVNDFMDCYNYVLNLSTGVEGGLADRDAKGIAVYPNPASDYISINTGVNDESVTEIKIYNNLGCCVVNLKQASHKVDISMLEPGIYSLVVLYDTGSKTSQFIVAR